MNDKTLHIKWPSIEGFHNVRKTLTHYPELTNGDSKVVYRGKVKLHGCNSAIQFHDGVPYAQSRIQVLGTVEDLEKGNDNAGFRRWMHQYKKALVTKAKKHSALGDKYQFCICGEWAGPGIQKGCAIHKIAKPIFAIFAVITTNAEETNFISEPDEITSALADLLDQIPEMYVLPWETEKITVDWANSVEQLQSVADLFNKEVERVENCDPWVKKTFGIEGTGEGLVYYPVSKRHVSRDDFSNLAFKAKGEKHKVVKAKKSVQVDPEEAASAKAFTELVVTEARLEQGLAEACNNQVEKKNLGKFIGWICKDVQKECQDELEASSLNWKLVVRAVSTKAREWFLLKFESE